MRSRVERVAVEESATGGDDGRSTRRLGRRSVLTLAIAALSTVGLVGTALANHKATYTATYTNGQLGPVTHYSDHASATGTTRTNDGEKHYIGVRVSYLEYYLGFWHTTGTTVGTTSIFRATYSATKTSGPPSQCRTAKFASDHYYNSSVERHLEAGDFIICP